MTIAINKNNFAIVDVGLVDTLEPIGEWIIDPQFDDQIRAFEVGPRFWVISGNTVHVMTDEEIDSNPATVNEIRLAKRAEINVLREQTFYSGFLDSEGNRWSSTPVDIANINAVCTLVAVGAVTENQTWRDYNNNDHSLSPQGLIMLAAQMAVFGKTCYATAWSHKGNIDALTKVSDISDYDITTGWPT